MNIRTIARAAAPARAGVNIATAGACVLAVSSGLIGCSSGGRGSGRLLLTLDDGDVPASVFADGRSGAASGGDTLTGLRTMGDVGSDERVSFAQAIAPNAMSGAGSCLGLSPDGTLAVVASGRTAAAGALSDQPVDNRLAVIRVTAVDEAGEVSLQALQTLDVGAEPVGVAFHPAGGVAAVLCAKDQTLVILAESADGLTATRTVPLGDLLGNDVEARWLAWHPSGAFVALGEPERDRVQFVEIGAAEDGDLRLARWGAAVSTGRRPAAGAWTPDGRFLITADAPFSSPDGDQVPLTASGTLSIVRVSDRVEPEGSVEHGEARIVRMTDSPDALAISADGKRIAVATRRPADLTLGAGETPVGGRLTLFSFDPGDGGCEVLSSVRASSLPTALAFDASGSRLFVADYGNNEVQVWRLPGDRRRLEYTGVNIGTGTGPHAIAVVR